MTTASRELAPALQGALRSRFASPSYTITGDTTKFDGLCATVDDPDLIDASIVQTDDQHGFILVRYKSRQAMEAVSNALAAPWFAENVRPLLAAPASRTVGQIVGGSLKPV